MLATFLNTAKCAARVFKLLPLHIEEPARQNGKTSEANSFPSPPPLFQFLLLTRRWVQAKVTAECRAIESKGVPPGNEAARPGRGGRPALRTPRHLPLRFRGDALGDTIEPRSYTDHHAAFPEAHPDAHCQITHCNRLLSNEGLCPVPCQDNA